MEAYEELALQVELTVQQLIHAHNYNTVGNFIRFYEAYRSSREPCLRHVFETYQPPITAAHHTCVGLGLELLQRLAALDRRFAGLSRHMYLVSCEEAVDHADRYVAAAEPDAWRTEKEHVLVAMRLEVAGRRGLMLLDPGYHVARVVTVMRDEMYPHTGWFTQSKEGDTRKDYNYAFAAAAAGGGGGKEAGDAAYVVWRVRDKRGAASPEKVSHSVVYVRRAFANPVEVAERRNLVYNFRSLLARNTKGQLIAGVYFAVDAAAAKQFTVFYQEHGVKQRHKLSFDLFECLDAKLDPAIARGVALCSDQLGLPASGLSELLCKLAHILNDASFVTQLLSINQAIILVSDDN